MVVTFAASMEGPMHPYMLHPWLEPMTLLFNVIAACMWLFSAGTHLTPTKPGMEELDKVHLLSGDLKRAARWNSSAAFFTALAVSAQIVVHWPV
jgi:hypothetical protein